MNKVKHLAAGGRRIEFTWHGPGPDVAPTLVFLHDGIGCAATWLRWTWS